MSEKGTLVMAQHNRDRLRHLESWPDHPLAERLPEYAAALALGLAPAEQYADIAAHLRECAACQADLDDLLEVIEPAYAEGLEPAGIYPPPRLWFLEDTVEQTIMPGRPWRLDAGRLLIAFSDKLLATLRQPALAGAARGRLLYRYIQEPGSVADLDVAIEVYAEDAAQHQGRVRVSVDVPSRGPLDQVGSRVVLHAGEVQLQGETDESGAIDFAPVPLAALPQLRVEIIPSND
jgi:hypothetical protein